MVKHSSATVRETPHLSAALKRRAESLVNDKSIDGPSRAIIRYGLETDDPWLAQLVRRVDAGENIVDNLYVTSDDEKIETLTALLVLMATLENSPHPKLLANTAKHLAFNRCGELNLHGMVDAEIKTLESELFTADTFVS